MTEKLIDRVARAIAESYDGYADPIETPANWSRAMSATRDAFAVIRDQFASVGNSSLDLAAEALDDELNGR